MSPNPDHKIELLALRPPKDRVEDSNDHQKVSDS